MSKKEQPKIKKVKIDEHIKKAKSGNDQSTPARKRGRPKKIGNPIIATDSIGSGTVIDSNDHHQSIDESINAVQSSPTEIQPAYDTTAEAKAFISAPFEIAAGIISIPALKLYPDELDAIAPSFKVVYDKRIAPYMGENADLIAFGMVFTGILFKKVGVYKEEAAKRTPQNKPQDTDSLGNPVIKTEHVT